MGCTSNQRSNVLARMFASGTTNGTLINICNDVDNEYISISLYTRWEIVSGLNCNVRCPNIFLLASRKFFQERSLSYSSLSTQIKRNVREFLFPLQINSILSFYSCVFLSNFSCIFALSLFLSLPPSHPLSLPPCLFFYHAGDCTARIIKLAENVRGGWRGITAGRSLCNTGTYVTAFYPVIVSPETFSSVGAGTTRAVNLLFSLDVNSFTYR